ncbi:MAG: DUF2085 domain-containing protein [Eubacteriales bacterium]|nr:DUF2085 domain-containing protein [Eubacteriales bacterium]
MQKINGLVIMQRIDKEKLWTNCMKIGAALGCHQLPERSFFYHGYQFPVCARCTGVLIGTILSPVFFYNIWFPTIYQGIVLCAPMLIDWILQYKGIKPSKQVRRLITGFLGGSGMFAIEIRAILYILHAGGLL